MQEHWEHKEKEEHHHGKDVQSVPEMGPGWVLIPIIVIMLAVHYFKIIKE